MYDEYNALVKNGTWVLVPRPACVNMVRSMWLFKHKFYVDKTLSRYKARLVTNGSSQQLSVDFDETFSLVIKPATIHTVFSLTGLPPSFVDNQRHHSRQWTMHQLDVKNAFLNGYAIRAGFYHSRYDSSLFIYSQGSQNKYALQLLERAHMDTCNPFRTPIDTESKLGPEGNNQFKDNKIDLLVQQYEQFVISDESIDSAFARFNTIITSLKALDEGYSSKNYVRKFLRDLHPKWRANVMAIKESKDLTIDSDFARFKTIITSLKALDEESKDLTSLSLDELIGNLKVQEMIIKKDFEIVKAKVKRKSLALKAKKESNEEYTMAVKNFKKFFKRIDPNHLIGECPKPPKDKFQRAFVGGSWSDSGEEDDEKIYLEVDLEPDEWIKDSGCSKHMTGNRKLFSTYKAYNGGNVIFGSNLRGNIIGVTPPKWVAADGNGYNKNGQNPSKTGQNRAQNGKRRKVKVQKSNSTKSKPRKPKSQRKTKWRD
nr:hypothetical protein [Tanacetum cinerariifolium]